MSALGVKLHAPITLSEKSIRIVAYAHYLAHTDPLANLVSRNTTYNLITLYIYDKMCLYVFSGNLCYKLV